MGSILFGTNIYADSYATVTVDVLNVRQSPKKEAAITAMHTKNDTVKIIDRISPEWFAVENNNGKTSYVSTKYVEVFKVKAKINSNGVNSRTYPKMNANINRQLNRGQDISIFYQVGDWYYTSLGTEAAYGFIHKKYVDSEFLYLVPQKNISEVKEIEMKMPQVSKGEEIVQYAKQFLGNPYRYGGTSLTRGVDCSGFTQQVMKKAGVSLQRSSAAQYASNGVRVSTNNLQPGDLLFYGYGNRVSHVGIYIGDKKMIHASSSTTGIIISDAFRTRGKLLIGAKRVL